MFASKNGLYALTLVLFGLFINSCNTPDIKKNEKPINIVFLHHSTGQVIWSANSNKIEYYLSKITSRFDYVSRFFDKYNEQHNKNYSITEKVYPKEHPYGWKNYPYDYYNIWVKHAGDKPFLEEETLEILTKKYDVIIFKHCFPGSNILENTGNADINSDRKSLENYKLQYNALKEKMHQFKDTKFIVWTVPALLESHTTKEKAQRADSFSKWVKDEWDIPDDNIFVWDFRMLETNGGIYLMQEYARDKNDSHPNFNLAKIAAPLFCSRIIDIIETNGMNTSLTGQKIIKDKN